MRQSRARATAELGIVELVTELNPSFSPPTWLGPIAEVLDRSLTEEVEAVISAPPQHGKAIDARTEMVTSRGRVLAGDVVAGDWLIGSDGGWTRVEGVFPQGEVDLFSVTLSDGASLTTCADHRWLASQRYGCRPRVVTTAHLSGDLFESDERKKWRIPIVDPIVGHGDSLPLEPYLLGAWLGDGTTLQGEITTADPEIVQAVVDAGFATSYEYPAGAAKTYGIPKLITVLKAIGVWGNKHVPEQYLTANAAVRLAVLQGLCDTDGTVAKNGSQQSYCSTRPILAENFRFLVNSLGGVCTERRRPAAKKISHEISFRLPEGVNGFRINRKQSRLNPFSARAIPRRFVAAVEPAANGHAVCFSVAATDSLFAAGPALILTHNTEMVRAALIHRLLRGGHGRSGYGTYNEDKARTESRKTRMLANNLGLNLWGNLGEWGVVGGPSLKFVGVGGSITGHPIDDLFVFDDLIKDLTDAESMTQRNAKWEWMSVVAETRCHPGVSKLCVATRWHPDDPSGRLIAEGVQNINLPAIDDVTGLPLWAEGRPLDYLLAKKKRLGPYRWASLYQGRPRPRGASIFGEPKWYDKLPVSDYAGGIGLDLAYTKKTSADWSVMVVLRRVDFTEMIAGKAHRFSKYYVIDVVRRQVTAPEFSLLIRATSHEHPGPIIWHASGTEKGSADFIREKVKRLRVINASTDKLVRSQDVAAAWNDGRVLLPNPDAFPLAKRWIEAFVAEMTAFTGINDPQDDQVDALGSAFAAVKSKSRGYSSPRKKRRGALRRM